MNPDLDNLQRWADGMNPDLDNLKRWAHGRPLRGLPSERLPMPVPTSSNTDTVCHPYYYRVTPSSSSGVDRWKNPVNHPDCAASVMQYSAKLTDFVPVGGLEDLSEKFNAYIRKIATFPGFFLERAEVTEEHHTSKDISLMIQNIVDAYQGYGTGDVTRLVSSIEKMAESILNKSTTSSDRAIFSQDTVTKIGDVVYITVFYTHLSLRRETSGKKTLVDQRYRINRSLLRINTSYFITYAEKLEEMIGDGGLDDWGKQLSSPVGNRKSCFAKILPDIIENLKEIRETKVEMVKEI